MSAETILQELEAVSKAAVDELKRVTNEEALLAWRTTYLGKNAAVEGVFQPGNPPGG